MSRPVADPARRTAYDVVHAVAVDDAYANLLLPRLLTERRVDRRDAALATELTYGTLRWQGTLDAVISAAARRPAEQLDTELLACLRIGAYQLLHTRVPPHAAVHATIELVRRVAGERVVGLANAVLRRVAERSWPTWVDALAVTDPIDRMAFANGYPPWIARALLDALAGDPAELAAAMAEDRPAIHLVARPGRISRDDLVEQAGPGATPGP